MTVEELRAAAILIPLIAIESSVIQSVGYDNGLMVVKFHGGSIRVYETTEALYSEFVFSDSAGKFFGSQIKGKLSSTLLTGQCPDCSAKHGIIGTPCAACGTGNIVREVDTTHKSE